MNFFSSLPLSVQEYVNAIVASGLARTIVLFGSRARGDHRENSDFDLAIEWIDPMDLNVLKLKAELDEMPVTLFKMDLLDINSANRDYLNEIKTEGKVLWQKRD